MSADTTVVVEDYRGGRDREIAALVLSIQNDEAGLDLTLEEQPDLMDIPAAYASGGFWIATAEEKVVGCIGLLAFGTCGVLKKLFVAARYRGAHGPAAALLEKVLQRARELGMDSVVLDTPAAATRSHRFYLKAGFAPITPAELPRGYTYPDRNSLLFSLKL